MAHAKHLGIRRPFRTSVALRLAALLAATPAWAAGTWIVDDSGGPGVNFTSIPPAIAAASVGDKIFVRAGSYAAFTFNKPLVIRGEPGVNVAGNVLIDGLAVGTSSALSSCSLSTLVVQNCAGGVLLEALTFSSGANPLSEFVLVDNCDDVRLRACSILGGDDPMGGYTTAIALRVANSRVEIVNSTLRGQIGEGLWACGFPEAGGTGLMCDFGSRVHVAFSSIQGGEGGELESCGFGSSGGNGGAGVLVVAGAEVILAGDSSNQIHGGKGGNGWLSNCAGGGAGHGGDGLKSFGSARYSGVTFLGGTSACASRVGAAIAVAGTGSAVPATPNDPTLALLGFEPGLSFNVTLSAPPGSVAHLWVGRTMFAHPSVGIVIELLTAKARLYSLGVVPASGVITANVDLPQLASGFILIAQADALLPSGETRRTNSQTMTVR